MYVAVIVFFVIFISLLVKNCMRPKNFPPGPPFLPLIGSWYAIPPVATEFIIPEWRKKYGNIIGHKMGLQYFVFIAGIEEVVSGLKHVNFQNRPPSEIFTSRSFEQTLGLFFGTGKHWSDARRFTLRYLHQTMGIKLEVAQHDEMLDLFSNIRSGEVIEINSNFSSVCLKIVLNLLMSKKTGEYKNEIDHLQVLTTRAFKKGRVAGIELMYPSMKIFFNFHLFYKTILYTQNFCEERIKEHRATFDSSNIRDFMDAFFLEQEKEKKTSTTNHFSDQQLVSCLLDLMQASSQTLGSAAAFILLYVSLNPSVQNKIHDELDSTIGRSRYPQLDDRSKLPYCEAVLNETMRINTVSPISLPHVVSEDTEFYGYTIPKNTMLLFDFKDSFMDSKVYSEPELFKPERFLAKDLKLKPNNFGLGKRSCIGDTLTKNVLFLFETYFFQKYSIALPKGHENPNTTAHSGFTTSPYPFKLIIRERTY